MKSVLIIDGKNNIDKIVILGGGETMAIRSESRQDEHTEEEIRP